MIVGVPVDAATLQHLYTLPPEEFVAARTALAKELRAAKDRETAAEVGKLRRPSVADWALNVVARDRAELVTELVDAAATMRDAQAAAVEGRGGADVRDAVRELRARTQPVLAAADEVVEASGRATGSQTAALTARLAEVAGNAAAAEQLRAGRLGSTELDAVDPFAGLEPADRPTRARDEPYRRGDGRAKPDRAAASRDAAATRAEAAPRRAHASAADRAAAKEALVAARKERNTARSELSSAQKALDRAEAAAAKAETELAAARDRVATAEQRAAAADQRWTAAFQRGSENVTK